MDSLFEADYRAGRLARIAAGKPMKAPERCPRCLDERDCDFVKMCTRLAEEFDKSVNEREGDSK